jgi:tetratricopeptide (TPR) repeat protein/predicted Ser/Thr protein kinase
MIGRTLLHYEVLTRIGAGGMGEVWRARDTRLGRDVAIKVLPPARGDDSVQKERLLREARAASALIHPNIITVHEINSADGVDFIVMEYVRGETLTTLLALGKLPLAQALDYAAQICDALKTAHDAGVVHRDLKPGNIMIAASGLVKVLDFGIAKRLTRAEGGPDTTAAVSLTMAGATIGTPAYMSPEQAVGDPVDARSDLFSFGVVLYQMLSGVLPFQGTTSLTLLRQVVHEQPRPLRLLSPDLPERLTALVEKCLAKEPVDRYPNAAIVSQELRRIASREATATSAADFAEAPTMAPGVAATRRRRWSRSSLIAAGVLLAAFAAAAWFSRAAFVRAPRDASAADAADANASASELYQHATELLRVYYREGNIDRAIRELELALQRRSPYPLAEARLSLAYWRKNASSPDPHWRSQALTYAESAVRGDSQLAFAQAAHGAALSVAGQLDKAADAYQRAFTLDPASADLLWRMGDLAVAHKDAKGAEEYYLRSVAAGPKEWEPYIRLGSFYYKQGRYQDALSAYEKARDVAKDYPRVYSNLAAVYHQLGRTDEAAAVLQRSLEIAPDSTTYSNLGTLLYFQGRYPEALSAFERGVALGANTYLRWGNLADAARFVAGKKEKAHESYTRAIQLVNEYLSTNPDDGDARSSLALYLIRDERPKEALSELDRVLGLKNPIPAVLFKAAIIAELAGQRARALQLLGRTLDAGYQLREIVQEPDLVKLRTDPDYHKLVSRYEK